MLDDLKVKAVPRRSGNMARSDVSKSHRRPLVSMNQYATGENIAFAAAKPKHCQRFSSWFGGLMMPPGLLVVAPVSSRVAARKAKILMPQKILGNRLLASSLSVWYCGPEALL